MIEKMELIRLEKGGDGTFGVLRLDGQVFCVTLEPPDRGNARDRSCIPAGRYRCCRVASPRFGDTFEVTDVPDRTHILLHPGNTASDTAGCVLLGREFGDMQGRRGVLRSGATFARLMDRCAGQDRFEFTIQELCGEGVCKPSSV